MVQRHPIKRMVPRIDPRLCRNRTEFPQCAVDDVRVVHHIAVIAEAAFRDLCPRAHLAIRPERAVAHLRGGMDERLGAETFGRGGGILVHDGLSAASLLNLPSRKYARKMDDAPTPSRHAGCRLSIHDVGPYHMKRRRRPLETA